MLQLSPGLCGAGQGAGEGQGIQQAARGRQKVTWGHIWGYEEEPSGIRPEGSVGSEHVPSPSAAAEGDGARPAGQGDPRRTDHPPCGPGLFLYDPLSWCGCASGLCGWGAAP